MSVQSSSWPRPHLLTVHDYYRMAEVGLLSPDDRTELIEGEIIDMPPIGNRHAEAVRVLNKRLLRAVGDVAEVSSQLPVRLSLRSEPQPDFAIIRAKADGYRNAHPVPGDVLLLVEIGDSTLRYDLGKRASLYAAHGIPEYCVFDLQRNRVWRHRAPAGREYTQVDEVTQGVLPRPVSSRRLVSPSSFRAPANSEPRGLARSARYSHPPERSSNGRIFMNASTAWICPS